jgi:predicted neuraminidase
MIMLKYYDIFEPTTDQKPAVCGINAHGSTVTELPNGKIMAVWYCGTAEKHFDVGIFTSTLDPTTGIWTPVVLLEKHDTHTSEGNPVIYYDEMTKRLWLFWVTMGRADKKHIKGGWSLCRVKCKHSDDLGNTWTEVRYLTHLWGRMTRNKPIRLSNGDLLLPIYSEWMGTKGNFLIAIQEEFAKGALHSKWIQTGGITGSVEQPTVVELDPPGHLLAYMRTANGGRYNGWISISESVDLGRHWTKARQASLPNPNAGTDMVKLKNGNIALAFNNSPSGRTPLSIGLSEDGGQTWPYIRNLEDRPNARFAYPGIIQVKDGTLYCSYTNDKGFNIRCAHFDEDWIKGMKK